MRTASHYRFFSLGVLLVPFDVEDEIAKITMGHVVPEFAGGKQWTILCKRCNDTFGSKQDKWLGEYLDVLVTPEATPLHASTISRRLTVNGVEVNGLIKPSDNHDGIDMFLHKDRNPPGLVDSIPDRTSPVHMPGHPDFDPLPSRELTVSFTPEVLKHEHDVCVGFITSAYLAWFDAIGYNWVLQPDLQTVREQIRTCTFWIDGGAKVVNYMGDDLTLEPSLGVSEISGEFYPSCRIYDKMVVFPRVNSGESLFEKDLSKLTTQFLTVNIEEIVCSMTFDGKPIVVPRLSSEPGIPELMLAVSSQPKPSWQWLRRIDDPEELQKIKQHESSQ